MDGEKPNFHGFETLDRQGSTVRQINPDATT
jgi:hypothetical protein